MDEVDDKVQLTTFKAGLRSRDLMASLAKNPPKTMAEMLLKAQKYMNAEDSLAAIKDAETRQRKKTTIGVKRKSDQTVRTMTGIGGKMIKVLGR